MGTIRSRLKGFLLLSRIYYFNEVLNTLGLACEDDFEFHNCFAEMLMHGKFCDVKVRRVEDEIELTDPIKSEFLSAETMAVFAELDKTFGIEGELYFKLSGIKD